MTGNFFDRWSRRKIEANLAEANLVETSLVDTGLTPPACDGQAAPADAPELSAEDIQELIAKLPDVATLTHESDFTQFMQPWVPADMRHDALRKLWTVDKSVLEHVPLADYALDYNTPGAAPGYGSIVTTAEMVADVARIMGKVTPVPGQGEAATQEQDGAGMPDRNPDVRIDAAAEEDSEPVLSGTQDRESASVAAARSPETGNGGAAAEPVAVRETSVAAQESAPVARRHGAAMPR